MNRTMLITALLCCMTAGCTTHEDSPSQKDPIARLVRCLDKVDDSNVVWKTETFIGGKVSTQEVRYSIYALTPEYRREEGIKEGDQQWQLTDSCLRAFRWGCSVARQCYHKEQHVLGKDTVLYALALDAMEGERTFLVETPSSTYYSAARSATLNHHADSHFTETFIEYTVREPRGEAEPYDETPINRFIDWLVKNKQGVKKYDVSYEFTAEDKEGSQSLVQETYYDEERTLSSQSTGRLYVVPAASAQCVQDSLWFVARQDFIGQHPSQNFQISHSPTSLSISGWDCEGWPYSTQRACRSKQLRAVRPVVPVEGDCYYILIIDETIGAFMLPKDFYKVLRVKDHKVEYIPGA